MQNLFAFRSYGQISNAQNWAKLSVLANLRSLKIKSIIDKHNLINETYSPHIRRSCLNPFIEETGLILHLEGSKNLIWPINATKKANSRKYMLLGHFEGDIVSVIGGITPSR